MIARIIRWLGLGVVLAAAAVLSFHGLRDLALAVGIPTELAWLLPVAVDAGAAVSCACWLGRDIPEDAQRFAQKLTWGLLVLTVVANAAQLGMHAEAITPPWWVAVLVGAIPPTVLGSVVHLAVLVGRQQEQAEERDVELDEALEQADRHAWRQRHGLVGDPKAERDRLAAEWKAENPDLGARALAPHLTEKGYPLSVSGAQSAYFTKSAS